MQYDVNVTREERWWMIEVPAIGGLTQARRISEIEDQARSLIAVTTDVPLSAVELGAVRIEVEGVGDVSAAASEVARLRQVAASAEQDAAARARQTASELVNSGVSLRDVGVLLGLSYQRVGQLVQAG